MSNSTGQSAENPKNHGRKCVICFTYSGNCIRMYHKFPRNPALSDKWASISGRKWVINESPESRHNRFLVCSNHFRAEDYTSVMRTRLQPDAVPCVNLGIHNPYGLKSMRESLMKKLKPKETQVPTNPDPNQKKMTVLVLRPVNQINKNMQKSSDQITATGISKIQAGISKNSEANITEQTLQSCSPKNFPRNLNKLDDQTTVSKNNTIKSNVCSQNRMHSMKKPLKPQLPLTVLKKSQNLSEQAKTINHNVLRSNSYETSEVDSDEDDSEMKCLEIRYPFIIVNKLENPENQSVITKTNLKSNIHEMIGMNPRIEILQPTTELNCTQKPTEQDEISLVQQSNIEESSKSSCNQSRLHYAETIVAESVTETCNAVNRIPSAPVRFVEDPDAMFLLSQLPAIKNISPLIKQNFQNDFIKLVQAYSLPNIPMPCILSEATKELY